MDDALGFIRRITKIVITIVLAVIVLNDGARVIGTAMRASDGLKAAMNAALGQIQAAPNDVATAQAAADAAVQAEGATLHSYNQVVQVAGATNRVSVTVEVSAPLTRTIVAGPIVGLITGVPSSRWFLPGAVTIKLRSTKEVNDIGGAR